jgi:hypothetical protein
MRHGLELDELGIGLKLLEQPLGRSLPVLEIPFDEAFVLRDQQV